MRVLVVNRNNRRQVTQIRNAMGEDWIVLCPGDSVLGFRITSIVFAPDWTDGRAEDYKWKFDDLESRRESKDTPLVFIS